MAAAVILETVLGYPLDNAPAAVGTLGGLVWGIYEMTSTENGDWIVLSEFSEIKYVISRSISAGALAVEAVQINATVANKLIFTAGSTDTIRVLVFGTPA